jgi:GxxExxY protein
MTENDLSYIIRGAIFKVYNTLGPGLLESVYVSSILYELKKNGLIAKGEVPLPVIYEGEKLELGFRIDILVNDLVLIEVKSVENLAEVHHKQVLTYLKLSNKKLGILVNFNTHDISKSIFRKVNNLQNKFPQMSQIFADLIRDNLRNLRGKINNI